MILIMINEKKKMKKKKISNRLATLFKGPVENTGNGGNGGFWLATFIYESSLNMVSH
jgi:hypothetical protein